MPEQRKYGVIYADPPWLFDTYSEKGKGRSASAHYNCLSLDDLAELPVADYAAENCALFMWATDTHLPQALALMSRWGFTYKTVAFYWIKLNRKADNHLDFFMGPGYWTRANPETCLLGVRGKPKRLNAGVRRLVIARVREHSRKPDVVRDRIEQLVAGPYVELFARSTKQGWDCVGDQVGLFDSGHVKTRKQPSQRRKKFGQQHSLLP